MTYVHVVPVRRMPVAIKTLTYSVPAEQHVTVGQLVEVPLRGRRVLGVIWATNVQPDTPKIQPLYRLVVEQAIISDWLRNIIVAAAQTGSCSLGDMLYFVIPKLSANRLLKILGTTVQRNDKATTGVKQPKRLWFRRRQEALEWIVRQSPDVVLCPTLADVRDVVAAYSNRGIDALPVTSDLSPTEVTKLFQETRQGEKQVIVGTLRCLFLPFPHSPNILIDQVEHHAHKITAQHPRLDPRVILDALHHAYASTTVSPTIQQYTDFHIPSSPVPPRKIVSLTRDSTFSWLGDETIQAIEQTHDRGESIVCIVPRTGYASSIACRHCGYTPTCSHCQHPASLFRGQHDASVCRFCRRTSPLPECCPTCRGTTWSYHGLGIERMKEIMAGQWPDYSIATTVRRDTLADIAVDTYSAYLELPHLQNIGLLVLASGDSLLNIPDYSTNERAWQYLARLQAFAEGQRVIVQTFQPEHPFWQRWLHGDDASWYADEEAVRRSMRLPPFATQWIIRWSGDQRTFVKTITECQQRYEKQAKFTVLPVDTRRPVQKCIVELIDSDFLTTFPWPTIFPTPWQVDQHPQSWLD